MFIGENEELPMYYCLTFSYAVKYGFITIDYERNSVEIPLRNLTDRLVWLQSQMSGNQDLLFVYVYAYASLNSNKHVIICTVKFYKYMNLWSRSRSI
jgi:hypothetical protein